MIPASNITAAELSTWLARMTQTIDRSLRDPHRAAIVGELRPDAASKIGLGMLAPLALLADCLRVANLAIAADGNVEADELARVTELVRVAADKYFQVVPEYESFDDPITDVDGVRRFLRVHQSDTGPFGFAHGTPWRGLSLVRAVEHHANNAGPLREHETLLARIMESVFAGRATEVEYSARRQLRSLFETPAAPGTDPRAVAFCRPDGPEVFSSIAYGAQVHERDPFDVEAIHAEARDAFHREVVRATTPAQHAGHGRTLLVLGDSGAGKTHLVRALRAQLHGQGLGYAGYMQMASDVTDYARYVLRNLIDSLERPYDAPAAIESALTYLSNGIAQGRANIPAEDLERLRSADVSGTELDRLVGKMIDRIVRTEGLERLEPDLLQALLLLQRRDVAIQRRVVKYLRCEHLGAHDREVLGGLAARDQAEDPLRTIQQLGILMYELQLAALVLFVDQLEDTIPDGHTATRMQQAFDSLRAISDAVPSAVVVIACLTDVYDAVRAKLSQPIIDRLERDSTPVRLATQRELPEIEEMLARRLEHLYGMFDVPWREDDPLYPFTQAQVEAVKRMRARDCLGQFQAFHAACIAAGHIVPPGVGAPAPTAVATPAEAPARPPQVTATADETALAELDRAWQAALAAETSIPDDDREVMALVVEGVRAAAAEQHLSVEIAASGNYVTLAGARLSRRTLGICNQTTRGGHLGRQLEALAKAAPAPTLAYALRTDDWTFGAKTAIQKQIGALVQAGGRTLVIGNRDLRAVLAWRALPKSAATTAWASSRRPLAQQPCLRDLLDLDRVAPVVEAPAAPAPSSPVLAMPKLPPLPAPKSVEIPVIAPPTHVRLGATATMRGEPVTLALEDVKTHVAVLGTTGSGKTTLALAMIEQLLERGISVLVVDRKGDLASYAKPDWWAGDARRAALRASIDVDLFTPGNPVGRPLRLPVIPALADATPQDRDQLAKFAAASLGTMMGYGKSSTHGHKLSILQCAIDLHAGDREITLAALHDTIAQPDPDLLQRVGALQKYFPSLSEDLQSLEIQKGTLLAGEGDALDVAAMLPAGGRARFTIINTAAIAEIPVLEFWISRLLVEVGRLARKRPAKQLQAAAFFDECDAYIPAIGAPPTKEPMFDLLRRARSAGIAMLLATQNPGDLDYKARELVGTWLVGKVGEPRAIEKMRNLLGSYPNVSTRLANQTTGQFFMLRAGKALELRADRSMMQTEQLAEHEIAALARR